MLVRFITSTSKYKYRMVTTFVIHLKGEKFDCYLSSSPLNPPKCSQYVLSCPLSETPRDLSSDSHA